MDEKKVKTSVASDFWFTEVVCDARAARFAGMATSGCEAFLSKECKFGEYKAVE